MQEHGYSLTNKLYESTVGVKIARTIEDDNLGIYTPCSRNYAAATHPDLSWCSACWARASARSVMTTRTFDTDQFGLSGSGRHGDAVTVSNLPDAAASPESKTPWFLLDVSPCQLKLIFQERTGPELTSQIDPRSDNVFMNDEYRYGVRYRCNVGFGFGSRPFVCGMI